MPRRFFLAAASAAAVAGSASAADMPMPPPPPPVPVFSWTGFYLGGQVGYAFGHDSENINFLPAAFFPFSNNPNGVIGGAHIGYNLQINQWVIGLEGSVDGTTFSRTASITDVFPAIDTTASSDIQGTIRGRVGIAWDRALLYATGGVFFAGIETSYYSGGLSDSFSRTRVGFTVGGGIEYAVTPNWSVRAEYRFNDFGSFTDFPFAAVPGAPFVTHDVIENQVQAGFSYKFGEWASPPVVAKY